MLQRLDRVNKVFNDPSNAAHRKLITLAIASHRPLIEKFNMALSQNRACSFRDLYGSLSSDVRLPRHPSPSWKFVSFGWDVAAAWDETRAEERRNAGLPGCFWLHHSTADFNYFGAKMKHSNAFLGAYLRDASHARDYLLKLNSIKVYAGGRDTIALRERLSSLDIVPASIEMKAGGLSFSTSEGIRSQLNDLEQAIEAVRIKLTRSLGSIARRLSIGFNPDLFKTN